MDGKTVLSLVATTLSVVTFALWVWAVFFGGPPLVWLALPLTAASWMAGYEATERHWHD